MSTTASEELSRYSACDISDALVVIQKKHPFGPQSAGFLCDLVHLNSKYGASPVPSDTNTASTGRTLVYPAFTVQFKTTLSVNADPTAFGNIPARGQWSDLVPRDSIVVVQQPPDQKNACVGGIHMTRIVKCGAKGLVIDGRVRDMSTVRSLDIPVWAKGVSTIGAAVGCKVKATGVPVDICDVKIKQGDIVCIDEKEGAVVCIQEKQVEEVLQWLRARGDSEDLILRAVEQGSTVADAFKQYR